MWLIPPWTVWAYWLGLVPVTWLREMAWPAPLNGLGKGAGVLCSLGWVYLWRRTTPAAAGLVRPAPGSVRAIAPAVLIVAAALLIEAYASRFAFLPLTAVQHLYYLTLPGLDEELFYRGALLGLLAPGLPRTLPLPGTRTSWGGVVGVLLFTLGHGLGYPDRLFELGFGADFWRYVRAWWSPTHFPLLTVLFQLGMGTFFLWVRERTGSAWVAALVHCLMNGCLSLGHAAG
ncbi:CPBP family glutamic-type intramembrane protease [Hymenobacter volaticus]|uniref:CPBP family glutamic-type intramembrane protease n=1 Tax=Hymenobacter volaticus TaxID=2932254 RepID=A0ABY4GF68_9BACT|nr:CPBP family glutamic-type intramembrane protease [Hymenobacter volaticus]UOQ69461.1 CPBP family glutamic-type intramembrane protease [Hymenobacter volaticus]